MGAGSDSNPDVLLIKHRRRSKRNIALFDQLTAPNKAFAQGSSFPRNFLNHRGQNSLAVHGWVWVGCGWLWPPIDPEMSGSQVAASKSRLAPPPNDSTQSFSRSRKYHPALPLMAQPFRGLAVSTVAATQLFKTALNSENFRQITLGER